MHIGSNAGFTQSAMHWCIYMDYYIIIIISVHGWFIAQLYPIDRLLHTKDPEALW